MLRRCIHKPFIIIKYPSLKFSSLIPRHDFSPNVDYDKIGKIDRIVSKGIYKGTNGLRFFGLYTILAIKEATDFTVFLIVGAKKINQRVLPNNVLNLPFSPFVHNSVIRLKKGAIMLNKIFDGSIHVVIFIGKNIGKIVGILIIRGFKMARYIATNKYSLRDFLPATQDSVEYFCKCSVNDAFDIIEAIDHSITSIFGASTDYVLQTIEHCFGENVKDISVELSMMSQEAFEFYKKVKLFKLRNLQTKVVKAGIKETAKTILNEIKKHD